MKITSILTSASILSMVVLVSILVRSRPLGTAELTRAPIAQELPLPRNVVLGGVLGQSADASVAGRLKTLTSWENGRLIALFCRDSVAENSDNVKAHQGTDWRGEHAGKWMYAAARAANRTGDHELIDKIETTADYLLSQQGEDGYLGTYAPSLRFTSDVREDFSMEWDIWNHTYNILGLLEINRYRPEEKYLRAAVRMGDLLYQTFYDTGKSVAYRGNHLGLSGTVVLEAIAELYKATGEQKYLDFAEVIEQQIEDRPGLQIVSRTLAGYDAQYIGDGKIYQLCWNYVGIAKLYEITGNPDYLKAAELAWDNIAENHLTLGGSPWGGIGGHHEVFNRKNYWTPYGFVETCNTMAWLQMNRELLRITGEAKYAEMIERAAYNALLGAQYPDGEGWCYHIFENGRRHLAVYRDCCRSSGMLALEELPPLVFGIREDGLSVNIYTASEGTVMLPGKGNVKVIQQTDYPFGGAIKIIVSPEKKSTFGVFVRIPQWADDAAIAVNGVNTKDAAIPGAYFKITRQWQPADVIELNFPLRLIVHERDEYESHRGTDIYRIKWQALTRGPLVYAIDGLIDGKKREDILSVTKKDLETRLSSVTAPQGFNGPAFQLELPDRDPLLFLPYYEAGGRQLESWRLTWFQME